MVFTAVIDGQFPAPALEVFEDKEEVVFEDDKYEVDRTAVVAPFIYEGEGFAYQ